MNYQVDVIIIGDSKDGHEAVKNIASANTKIRTAFISREFKSTTTHDYLNVEYIKEEVVFTDYKNRLFGCYLKNGDIIYGTHLIDASGLRYEPLIIHNKQVPCVFNNTYDIPKNAKNQPAIVLGSNNVDVKFALSVTKKYKYVYLCTKSLNIEDITAANVKKLSEAKNIQVLPNTYVLKVHTSDGELQKVDLDNYSTVTCSAIYVKTTSKPESDFVSDKLIKKDIYGYLEVANNAESTVVPKCFAIGNCINKYTKKMSQLMVESVLNDF
jgi:thioredoxin reductase